jgi:hypothetical protein
MSTLVPERTLLFSPALAATIGLEEAILLHLLHDLSLSRRGSALRGLCWFDIERQTLEELLPFWSANDLNRIALNLTAKGILHLDTAAPAETLRYAFEPSLSAAATSKPEIPATAPRSSDESRPGIAPRPQSPLRPVGGATLLPANWQPADDLLQLLGLNHGIPRHFALAQVEDFVLYWRERGEASHAWASRFRQHVLRQWRLSQQQQAESERRPASVTPGTGIVATTAASGWRPSDDALRILERSGVSRAFIEDAIPEFVLYWRERGDESSTWNSKFIAHIRRQWARYSSSLGHEREPHPIDPRWQPSEDVYDILRMANIDIDFARDLIPEFVLFWRDAGTPQRSWNTKFLQHVKHHWALRLQRDSRALSEPAGAFARLTDRSWASGLVDGV